MDSCLFCRIAAGDIPCTEVFADDAYLAFRDIDPQAPTHILVIPRRHVASLDELREGDADLVGGLVLRATGIARDEGLADDGYRFVVNCGEEGGQTVDHVHLHILGGRPLLWPPG